MNVLRHLDGQQRKAEALDRLEAERATYVLMGRRALLQCLLATGSATADDVRDAIRLPEGMNPKVFGAVPGPLATAGVIVPDGYRPSQRPEAHGRPVQVWRLLDAEGATDWLRANPAPAEWIADSASAGAETPTAQGTLFDFGNRPATAEGW